MRVDFLERMMETASPSGFEGEVQREIKRDLEEFCDEVRIDTHGNVIGVLNPSGQKRIMICGHCDEIGLMVTYIDDNGFIYFSPIGGIDPMVLPGQRVTIHTKDGKIFGCIGRKPIHLLEEEERKKVPKTHELWIDIGAKDKEDAESAVKIGDPITILAGFQILRNEIAMARGFDDRIGVFIVVETLRELSKRELSVAVYGVSTVQEELGLRGARTSAFGIDPHAGIAIDVGFATDHPEANRKRVGEVKLGKGPILHKGANINPVLGNMLIEVAQEKNIPYQLTGEPRATGTDANVIQITRSGVATALVSIPNRYMHTPTELVSLKDVENCIKLLCETISKMPHDIDFTPF